MKKIIKKMSISILLVAAIAAGGCSERESLQDPVKIPGKEEIVAETPVTPVPENPTVEDEPKGTPTAEDPTAPVPDNFLVGTKWKLIEIGIAGTVRAPEPNQSHSQQYYWIDLDQCYRINFDTGNTLSGSTSTNEMSGKYELSPPSTIRITEWGGTKIGELHPDGKLFWDGVRLVHSYYATDTTLKLVYNETDYFLFELR
ncbi:MAG: META domain-containing protein [Tannerella sp.]|jgi:hypothetical protein|nr:META domain-containing protein [Tannerella sp.]